jgi:AcrR family transcriptional regulator
MGRWEPGADRRLREAALTLYLERGFEQTMVADIAERAGVTTRTFFRHFGDKRETLFDGWSALQARSLAALEAAPDPAFPLELVAAALDSVAEVIGADPTSVRRRQSVIAANAELQERELIKLTSMSTALAEGLRQRGIDALEANLAAETGLAVYRVAFGQWVTSTEDSDLRDIIRTAWSRLRALTGQTGQISQTSQTGSAETTEPAR